MTPNTTELQSVMERVRQLEAQCVQLKGIGVVALGILSFVVLMGQAAPKNRVIEAERFVLRDSAGTIRADLTANEETTTFLLSDVHGQPRAALSVIPKGPILLLRDEPRSKRWVTLELFDDGSGLELNGLDGEYRAGLRLVKDDPSLTFFGSDNTPHVGLGLSSHGPNLLLSGPGNKGNMDLHVDPERGPGITFQGKGGEIVWTAPTNGVLPGSTKEGEKPRIFIEVWSTGGPIKAQQKAEPSGEIAAFAQGCPQVVVTRVQDKANYVLRLEHHTPGGGFLRPQNPPADYDLDFWRSSVFDTEGSQITMESSPALASAVDSGCRAILYDWTSNSR